MASDAADIAENPCAGDAMFEKPRTRRRLVIEQLLRDANQVAYALKLRRDFAAISGRPEPDAEAALVTTDFIRDRAAKRKG